MENDRATSRTEEPERPEHRSREVVLVTGASSGLGRELARRFAADRSQLVLVARRRELLEQLATELERDFGTQARILPADLADPGAGPSIYDQLTQDGLQVDVLVNNAGFGALGRLIELDTQRQLDMVQVNVTSLVHLTRLFLPDIVSRGRGGVLNVASLAGFQPGPGMAVYFASKAFVLSFTEALADEVRGRGVHITCLAPGATTTQFSAVADMGRTRLFNLRPMSAATVADAGHRGFRRGKALVVPGLSNQMTAFATRLLPRAWVRRVTESLLHSPTG